MGIGQKLLDVPFGEMISSLGLAIAQAQYSLDQNSIEILRIMGEDDTVSLPFVEINYSDGELALSDNEISTSMVGAGFQPTFYQFAETVIEVKIAISMSYERSYENTTGSTTDNKFEYKSKKTKSTVTSATTVDATYSSKYNYSAEGSSLLRTRLVPVPPNPIVSKLIEMRNQAMEKYFEIEFKRCEDKIAVAEKALVEAEEKKTEEKKTEEKKTEEKNKL